jgi:nitroreductase
MRILLQCSHVRQRADTGDAGSSPARGFCESANRLRGQIGCAGFDISCTAATGCTDVVFILGKKIRDLLYMFRQANLTDEATFGGKPARAGLIISGECMIAKETYETMYREIFRRKSVRQYKPDELDAATLDAVKAFAAGAVPLAGAAAFRVLSRDRVVKPFGKAPYYLAVYAAADRDSRVNASFMLQQVSLLLSAQGIGSCYVGMGKPVQADASADGLPFAALFAFGIPDEPLYRQPAEFKRKPLSAITDSTGMEALLEPLRLAPSGINRQTWYVSADAGKIRLFMAEGNAIVRKITDPLVSADTGIALCHLWISALHENRFSSFEKEQGTIEGPRKYLYMWTVTVQNQKS